MSLGYSTPGPVRQFVVTDTRTVGLSGLLADVGLSVAARGGEVAVAIFTVAVSVGVVVGVSDGVSVASSVLV